MKSLLYTLSLLSIVYLPARLSAQGENNQWCFGQELGLNFNTTPPSFFQTNMKVLEGSATICDQAGNILFYSSGTDNWDKNGNLMPNGQGLNGNGPENLMWPGNNGASASGVAIIPSPSNTNQYFLFVTDALEESLYNVYYSVIDMSLNGGLGDVVPAQKNILLSTDVSEGVISIAAAGCSGHWAILHSRFGKEYRAFKVDNNGVSLTPVISTGLVTNTDERWRMRFNNSGAKLVRLASGFHPVEAADFNNATGTFSSFVTFQLNNQSIWSCLEFSPDDTKLYCGSDLGLTQYNISLLPDATAIQNTRLQISTAPFTAMRLGPDNKIYLLRTYLQDSLHTINNPNASGAGCQLEMNAMYLPVYYPVYTNIFHEFGSRIWSRKPTDTITTLSRDTVPCPEEAFTLHAPAGYQSYTWSTNATTPSETVYQSGVYWSLGIENCILHIDSFQVHFNSFPLNLGPDTFICPGAQIALDATTPDAIYKWQDNSTGPEFIVSGTGTYKVDVTVGDCTKSDSIVVDLLHPFVNIQEPDTTICPNEAFVLHSNAYPQSTFAWNTGSQTESISVNTAGTYTIRATNICGTFFDSVRVQTKDCGCHVLMPSAFSPNDDGSNDVYQCLTECPITGFLLKIFNRYGQCVFESNNLNKNWNGYYNNKPAETGTYFYFAQYQDNSGALIERKGDIALVR